MPIQQLPLMKGVGKDFRNADYIDYLPVNMLATPKEILNSSGYLRSFPGIAKRSDVNGISRGVEYNMAQSAVYRVCGGKLYKGESEVGDVAGSGRVSMAHGRTSQAVGVNGQLVEYRYDGTVKTVSNWPTDSGFTQYELGSVRDITRLRGRYAWSKDGTDSWFITDLEDESHPDRYSAQYRAESQPDGIIGIGTWRDFIVCFGSSTIEYFSLTGATTVGAALYVAQPSLMVQKGIAGTYCKTPFADSYAFISNPATGAPSVYIIGSGQVSPIASASIEKILRSYTADELADGVMESLRFDAHELLIIHLPRHVLVYDASSSANAPQWCVLKTGLYDDVYRAIDFIYEGNQITCGDKLESVTGKLQFDISSQYDKQQEHLLFTPLFKADNARVFDYRPASGSSSQGCVFKLCRHGIDHNAGHRLGNFSGLGLDRLQNAAAGVSVHLDRDVHAAHVHLNALAPTLRRVPAELLKSDPLVPVPGAATPGKARHVQQFPCFCPQFQGTLPPLRAKGNDHLRGFLVDTDKPGAALQHSVRWPPAHGETFRRAADDAAPGLSTHNLRRTGRAASLETPAGGHDPVQLDLHDFGYRVGNAKIVCADVDLFLNFRRSGDVKTDSLFHPVRHPGVKNGLESPPQRFRCLGPQLVHAQQVGHLLVAPLDGIYSGVNGVLKGVLKWKNC